MTKQANVKLILDREFGSQVASVAGSEAVWLVASEANLAALQGLGPSARARISTFGVDDERGLESALELIEEHHNEHTQEGPWYRLTVLGISASLAVRDLLEEFGATSFKDIKGGIEASKE